MARRKHAHLYNSAAWLKRRLLQLSREPMCRHCRIEPATVADHIEPHRGDHAKFYHGALQSLCARCHNGYKQVLEKSGRVLGCDENGLPLDPRHHWNRVVKNRQ